MSETVEAPGTALAILGERALVATEVFKPGGVRVILDQIKASVAAEKIDVSTPAGREHCRSLAFKIARSKTALDGMGKTLSDEWRKRAEAIHTERRLIEKELDALRDQVRAPLTAYEEREKKRVQAHEEALKRLVHLGTFVDEHGNAAGPGTVAEIDEWLVEASTLVTTRAWEEFQQRASDAFAEVNDALNDLRAQVITRDKERAEAARLQAEREEQARLQAVREQEAREARLAAEAAEKASREAEAAAERRYAAELEEQRQRAAAAHQAELSRVQAEERAKARVALDAKIKQERIDAEQRAAQRAQEARDAAVIAERDRVAEGQRAAELAAKQREANVAHKRRVNNDARDAIVKAMSEVHSGTADEARVIGTAIVIAIATGAVPRCRIEY